MKESHTKRPQTLPFLVEADLTLALTSKIPSEVEVADRDLMLTTLPRTPLGDSHRSTAKPGEEPSQEFPGQKPHIF